MMKTKARAILLIIAVVATTTIAVSTDPELILRLAPYSYEEPIPNPGEGADEIWIDTTPGTPGGEMTLQEAVQAGFISIDTRCDAAGSCPQVCINEDCRNSWPGTGGVITQLNSGSGISLSPSTITSTGTISTTLSDTRCSTSGTCSQVCIGSDCRNSWPTGHTFSVGGQGSCTCDHVIASANASGTGCAAASSTGLSSSSGANGRCCVCST